MTAPTAEVLDLFAVPDAPVHLPGGGGREFRAGDLVLSAGHDAGAAEWLRPVLARLSVRLDESPTRTTRDLRVGLPVPARDGSWVVDGWAARRHEPGESHCDDLDVTLAAGRLLHAQLAVAVPERPPGVADGDEGTGGPASTQLVHTALTGRVLLDAAGAPLVVDVEPAWGTPLWAEALCVVDAVARRSAPTGVLRSWSTGARREAVLRAVAWRARDAASEAAYGEVLSVLAST